MQTVGKPTQPFKLPAKSQPLKIVALGDSLVYGHGDPVGGGWVERVRCRWMKDPHTGHVLYNLGIRGDRVSQVAERLEGEFRYRGELRNQVPDLIILSVGVNDSPRLGQLNGRLFTDFTVFEQQINHLLNQAQQLCPVIFIGMVPVDEEKMPLLGCFYFNHFDQYRYKEATKKACNNFSIPYLDIFDLWLDRGEDWLRLQLTSDGLHPNLVGYKSLLKDIIDWQFMTKLMTDIQLF
ncbi:GDSL-type esterase/lipase family protein [cyanobacterium endosymbiont of Epithemia clementina EcSB]|uniref:GDSL-type esterase/lipase family protein n=1 Tax=cyanobacterium endosymbiont of Epithemia clementina EcSB TaxID=3034674 RepID=UPI002481561C|nr:GDSL-type esterase/lipase family protein [cyanobacterium endosymbiont of Epithemia clementina EcSB]WGT67650.1 GDSL-type esterase/lipase family protein [cyanobacterium endosymbiont of Epithemia clementina EcSB]